ncbi:DUF6906 family protein [Capilliphycus salinus ALCB114379]
MERIFDKKATLSRWLVQSQDSICLKLRHRSTGRTRRGEDVTASG